MVKTFFIIKTMISDRKFVLMKMPESNRVCLCFKSSQGK